MKTIISDSKKVSENAAEHIKALLEKKPEAVLAFSAGKSMEGLFARLAEMCAAGGLSFAKATVFAVTEFAETDEELSCRRELESRLLDKTDILKENCFFPSEDGLKEYDELIAGKGGIDLVVLGIGPAGQIGYNEPATPFGTMTHVQKLTDSSRKHLAERFGAEDRVPEKAVTMGIKTITEAKDIILIALGSGKAEAVHKMLYARNDSLVPAAYLQIPFNATVYLDKEAAEKV
ncbi:MAG: glucosamine-6-phosphate deaminase [Candidatus Limivicinus sp.]|jgi:glucosamine-6-phosphate deaminase